MTRRIQQHHTSSNGSQDSLLRLLLLSVWLIGNAVALDQENPSTDLTHGTVTTIALHGF